VSQHLLVTHHHLAENVDATTSRTILNGMTLKRREADRLSVAAPSTAPHSEAKPSVAVLAANMVFNVRMANISFASAKGGILPALCSFLA